MNAFEYIDEMIDVISKSTDGEEIITKQDHYNSLTSALQMLRQEMENAEYNYVVQSVEQEVITFSELVLLKKQLTDDVIIFQPIAIGEEELSAIDMQSIANTLTQMKDSGIVKENILLLPPNINIFKAKLSPKDRIN